MRYSLLTATLAANLIAALPFMGYDAIPNAGAERTAKRQLLGGNQLPYSCPYNDPKDHVPAVPLSDKYPYLSAVGTSKQGTGKGGIQVPAPGDVDHMFIAPKYVRSLFYASSCQQPLIASRKTFEDLALV